MIKKALYDWLVADIPMFIISIAIIAVPTCVFLYMWMLFTDFNTILLVPFIFPVVSLIQRLLDQYMQRRQGYQGDQDNE